MEDVKQTTAEPSPRKASKMKALVAGGVAALLLLVGGYYLFFDGAGEDQPPSLGTGSTYQGLLVSDFSGLTGFTADDVTNFQTPTGFVEADTITFEVVADTSDPNYNGGVGYFYADEDLTVRQIMEERIVPAEDLLVSIAHYRETLVGTEVEDIWNASYNTFWQGPNLEKLKIEDCDPADTACKDLDDYTIKAGEMIVILASKNVDLYLNDTTVVPAASFNFCEKDAPGWINGVGSTNFIGDLEGQNIPDCILKISQIWSYNADASRFEKVYKRYAIGDNVLDDFFALANDDINSPILWVKFTDTPAPGEENPIICGDGELEGAEVCDDGNDVDGDGCNTLCKEEVCDYTDGTDGCNEYWVCEAPDFELSTTTPRTCDYIGAGVCDYTDGNDGCNVDRMCEDYYVSDGNRGCTFTEVQAVDDLVVTAKTTTTITLEWTPIQDNDPEGEVVASYAIKVTDDPAADIESMAGAMLVGVTPGDPGDTTLDTYTVDQLTPNTEYRIAIVAVDSDAKTSMSNVVTDTTLVAVTVTCDDVNDVNCDVPETCNNGYAFELGANGEYVVDIDNIAACEPYPPVDTNFTVRSHSVETLRAEWVNPISNYLSEFSGYDGDIEHEITIKKISSNIDPETASYTNYGLVLNSKNVPFNTISVSGGYEMSWILSEKLYLKRLDDDTRVSNDYITNTFVCYQVENNNIECDNVCPTSTHDVIGEGEINAGACLLKCEASEERDEYGVCELSSCGAGFEDYDSDGTCEPMCGTDEDRLSDGTCDAKCDAVTETRDSVTEACVCDTVEGFEDYDLDGTCEPMCGTDEDRLSDGTCDAKCDAVTEIRDSVTEACVCDTVGGFEDYDLDGTCEPMCGTDEDRLSDGTCDAKCDAVTETRDGATEACVCDTVGGFEDYDSDGTCEPVCGSNETRVAGVCECSGGFEDYDSDGTCEPVCVTDYARIADGTCKNVEPITFDYKSTNSILVDWSEASDVGLGDFTYKFILGLDGDFLNKDLAFVEAYVALDESAYMAYDIGNYRFGDLLPSESYDIAIILKDADGNKTLYKTTTVQTFYACSGSLINVFAGTTPYEVCMEYPLVPENATLTGNAGDTSYHLGWAPLNDLVMDVLGLTHLYTVIQVTDRDDVAVTGAISTTNTSVDVPLSSISDEIPTNGGFGLQADINILVNHQFTDAGGIPAINLNYTVGWDCRMFRDNITSDWEVGAAGYCLPLSN